MRRSGRGIGTNGPVHSHWYCKKAEIETKPPVDKRRSGVPYRYRDEIAVSDVVFDAWGKTLEELLISAADALMNVQVEDLSSIRQTATRKLKVRSEDAEMLLFDLLQEIIYYKDAERLLLRIDSVSVREEEELFLLDTDATGERIDPSRHVLNADVKAVTLSHFPGGTNLRRMGSAGHSGYLRHLTRRRAISRLVR